MNCPVVAIRRLRNQINTDRNALDTAKDELAQLRGDKDVVASSPIYNFFMQMRTKAQQDESVTKAIKAREILPANLGKNIEP